MSRRLAALAALLGAALVAGLLSPGTASAAEHCFMKAVKGQDGSIHYVKVCVGGDPGAPGGGGGGGGTAPPCETDRMAYDPMPGYGGWYCVGKAVCAIKENVVPYQPPATPAPAGQEWKVQHCWPCNGCLGPPTMTWVLDGPQARPLIVQAEEAFGNLDPPAGAVRHSPIGRAVVRLETWLWLDPGSFGRLTGSSAEGLVAVAEPDTTIWRPGDGASLTCAGGGTPYGSGGQGCTHVYTKASPAYHGSVTRRWVVHYENGGAPVDIPGAPDTLTAVTTFDLAVVETQVLSGD